MNVYERILNILLEARVDMFIQDRLDEAKVDDKLSPAEKEVARNKRAEYKLQGGGTKVPDTKTRRAMNKPVPKSPAMKNLIRQTKGGISPVQNPARSMKQKADPAELRLRLKQHSVKDKPKPQIP